MIEASGHVWNSGFSSERCRNCQMKYGYYLEIEQHSIEQPNRQYLKDVLKCRSFRLDGKVEK